MPNRGTRPRSDRCAGTFRLLPRSLPPAARTRRNGRRYVRRCGGWNGGEQTIVQLACLKSGAGIAGARFPGSIRLTAAAVRPRGSSLIKATRPRYAVGHPRHPYPFDVGSLRSLPTRLGLASPARHLRAVPASLQSKPLLDSRNRLGIARYARRAQFQRGAGRTARPEKSLQVRCVSPTQPSICKMKPDGKMRPAAAPRQQAAGGRLHRRNAHPQRRDRRAGCGRQGQRTRLTPPELPPIGWPT